MNELFKTAAGLVSESSYDRKTWQSVQAVSTNVYSMTGYIERANCFRKSKSSILMNFGDLKTLIEAKSFLCRHLKTIHLDLYEMQHKSTWQRVKEIFLEAYELTLTSR